MCNYQGLCFLAHLWLQIFSKTHHPKDNIDINKRQIQYRFNATLHLHASASDTTRECEWYSSRVRVVLLTSASGTTCKHKISREL